MVEVPINCEGKGETVGVQEPLTGVKTWPIAYLAEQGPSPPPTTMRVQQGCWMSFFIYLFTPASNVCKSDKTRRGEIGKGTRAQNNEWSSLLAEREKKELQATVYLSKSATFFKKGAVWQSCGKGTFASEITIKRSPEEFWETNSILQAVSQNDPVYFCSRTGLQFIYFSPGLIQQKIAVNG